MTSRVLERYPSTSERTRALAVVVTVTITLYYALYVKGSVAPQIIDELDMSLWFYVSIAIAGNILGAFGALSGAVTDRVGRSRLVLTGTGIVGVMTLLVIPQMPNKQLFLVADVAQTIVLGAILATMPALIRDFAPQLNRATAMATWNLGPILGSLLVSSVASNTLDDRPEWRFQFYVCGTVVLAAWALAVVGLRELSPALRAQLVVSAARDSDVAAVEQRAAQTHTPLEPGAWRQLLRPRILLPALGISLFLTFYFTRLGFWVIFFVTTYGFRPAEANGLSNWWWATSALALPLIGLLSDRLGVRKPIMLLGACGSVVALWVFGSYASDLSTTYSTFILLVIPAAAFGVMTNSMWITAFSEAIEAINPALVATGMAIYGWIVRLVAASVLVAVVASVGAASTLVDHGAEVGRITTEHAGPLAKIEGATRRVVAERAATRIPADDLAYLTEHGADVAAAVQEGPDQWGRWWRVALVMQVLFIPTIFLLPGPWRRRRTPEPGAPGAVREPVGAGSR